MEIKYGSVGKHEVIRTVTVQADSSLLLKVYVYKETKQPAVLSWSAATDPITQSIFQEGGPASIADARAFVAALEKALEIAEGME